MSSREKVTLILWAFAIALVPLIIMLKATS